MIRCFLPIGQGGFAVEQFRGDRHNIVFDCGTSTGSSKKSNMNRMITDQIKQTFDPNTRIQKVFISHLHADHINGLPFLLKYCRVERVYLPYLTPSEQVVTLLLLREEINDDNGPLLQHLITGRPLYEVEFETSAVYVLPSQPEDFGENVLRRGFARSGQHIPLDKYNNKATEEWLFIPFVYKNAVRSKQFEEILKENGLDESIQQQILTASFWKDPDLVKQLKKVYEKIVSEDINLTTMVVWSGPKSGHGQFPCKEDNCVYMPKKCCRQYYEPGCLYLGDYPASKPNEWNELRGAYDPVWSRTGVFTIPHHGSSYNFQPELIAQCGAYIINAGYQNTYGHPHQKVLRYLVDSGCQFYWVNERRGSEVIFQITL